MESKYLIRLTVLFVTFVCVSSQACPYGWSTKRYSDTWPCYLMTNKIQRTWKDAQTFCQWMGGDLLKLESGQERDWVFATLKAYTGYYSTHTEWWIGLHDNQGQITWTDGTPPQANLLPWAVGETIGHYDHSKACVEYNNGSIKHQDCLSQQYFVCKRPRENAVWCDALKGWESIQHMCFKLVPKLKTWDDARGECQKESADLVVVNKASMATVVNNFMESRKANVWIALRAFKNNTVTGGGYFSWKTKDGPKLGMLVSYFNTQTPLNAVINSNFNQSCVFANASLPAPNQWQIGNCGERRFSVCQKPEGRCSAGWIENNFVCYLFKSRPKSTWMDAKNYCQQRGATLLYIQSPSEQTFINTNMGSFRARGIGSIWLGLSDNNGSRWTWTDGTVFAPQSVYMYNNLNGQNPANGPGMQCFTIYTDDVNGTWQLASNCTNKKSFICQIPAQREPKIPTTPAPTGPTTSVATILTSPVTWSSDCGPFWVKDSKTGYCYKFSDDTLSWFQARHSCESQGAQLTSINTYHEEKFLIDFVFGFSSPALWIGVNNLVTGSGYNWIDGTGFGYINWAPGEPNNVHDNEHCAEFIIGGDKAGQWNDINCNQRRGYICKKRSTDFSTLPPPTTPLLPVGKIFGCPDATWLGYGNNCFLFQRSNLSWTDSRTFCESQGYNLASIASENEQNFVFSQIPANTGNKYSDQYWIGLNDVSIQMIFRWTDGSPVRYTNWEDNEPNNYQDRREDCVAMYHDDGRWNDAPCYTSRAGFVCKTPKIVLPFGIIQADTGHGCSMAGSIGYGYMCYLLKQGQFVQTWDDANLDCVGNQGTLATVHDRHQQAFLASQIAGTSYKYFWIGLSDKAQNGHLAWFDGKLIDFTAWSANHTGNAVSICISMRTQGPGVGLWVDQNCVTQLPYICQYPRTGYSTPLITSPTTLAPPVCPAGWFDYKGYCYQFHTTDGERQSWFGARDFCQSIGADLISIHTSDEQGQVFSNQNVGSGRSISFWIGLNDFGIEKDYKWTDGTAVNYTHWGAGEPNDSDGTDDCVEYNRWGDYWNDNTCYIAKPYVCKIRKGTSLQTPIPTAASTMPAGCGAFPGWKLFNGSCYLTSDNVGTNSRRTWYGARDFCNQQGAELTSIHSEQENGFLVTLLSLTTKHDSWIGLKDVGQNQFRWSDASLVDYTKWTGNEPNDAFGSEKCAQLIQYNGYWNDNDCNENYHFICKKNLGSTNPITPVPTSIIMGECPPGYTGVKTGNKCFNIYGARTKTDRKQYTQARDACRSQGQQYDIASLNSHLEIATVVSMVNGVILDDSDVWIGLNDQNNNNKFTWQDSSRLLITNWDKGQPMNGVGGKCVAMSSDSRHAGLWHNLRCSTIRPYVCETIRNSSITPTTGYPGCLRNDYVSNGLDCFKVHTEKVPFTQAEGICVGEGAHLTSVISVYEQAFIDTLVDSLNVPIWIGLRDPGTTGTYSWSDNSPIIFNNWNQGEPTYQSGEGCVTTNQGAWNDSMCQNTYPFVCKISFFTPPPPTGYPSGYCRDITWRQHGDFCYYVSLDSPLKTWSEADQDCVSRGMQLVSITDRNEETFVLQELDHSIQVTVDLWLGFKKIDGHYQWVDGTTQIRYINWDTYRGTYDCVKLQANNGKWQDVSCDNQLGYVCKTPKLPATSPTTPTTTISTQSTSTSTPAPSTSTTSTSTPAPSTSTSSKSSSTSSSTTASKTSLRSTITLRSSSSSSSTNASPGGVVTPTKTSSKHWLPPKSQQSMAQSSQTEVGTDLSGGQVAGIIIGVACLIAIVCGILFFLKRRGSPDKFFSFASFRNEENSGFDNAVYDKQMQSVQINGKEDMDESNHVNGFMSEFSDA